jgi:hypothetical protein
MSASNPFSPPTNPDPGAHRGPPQPAHPPPRTDAVPAAYLDGGAPYYFLAAYGRAGGLPQPCPAKPLVACLVDQDPHGGTAVYPGVLHRAGLYWVIGFPRLPQKGTTYFLMVGRTDDPANPNLSAVLQVKVVAPGVRPLDGSIPINYPTADSTVCPSFVAYGSLVNNTPTTGASMSNTGNNVSGVPITTGVPPGIWMYQFSNVPEGSDYTFSVTDGTNTGQAADITVDQSVCGQTNGSS